MKGKGVFFRVAALLLLSLIISSFVALSASAVTVDTAYSDGAVAASSPLINTGWGSGDNDDAPEPSDAGNDMDVLLIIFISMSVVTFGALAFKLFSDRISKKELVILLLVLIFVVVIALVALYINFAGKSPDGLSAATALVNKNIFWEVKKI